jgi:ligand-binding SRPBCC domain-containing protein
MLSMRAWEHERRLDADGDGRCRLSDRLSFEPRAGLAGPLLERFIRVTFRHRHRRLKRYFGGG